MMAATMSPPAVLTIEEAHKEFETCSSIMDQHGHTLDVFRVEYQQLYDAIVASNEGLQVATRKTEQLSAEINVTREKLAQLETYDEDAKGTRMNMEVTIDTMKKQLKETAALESRRRKAAKDYYEEIDNLKRLIAQGPDWTDEQMMTRDRLSKDVAEMKHSVDLRRRDEVSVRSDVDNLTAVVAAEEVKVEALRARLKGVEKGFADAKDESSKSTQRKGRLEEQLHDVQTAVKRDAVVLKEKKQRLRLETERITQVEAKLRDSKAGMEEYFLQYNSLFRTIQRLGEELEAQIATNDELKTAERVIEAASREKQADAALLHRETNKLVKLKQLTLEKVDKVERERRRYEEKRDAIKQQIHTITTVDLKAERRLKEVTERQVADVGREKDILDRKYLSSDKATQLIYDLSQANQSTQHNLLVEISAFKSGIKDKRRIIESMVGEKDQHEAEAAEHSRRFQEKLEELKLQDIQMKDLQRSIANAGGRLKQQQNLYKAVRSDRNTYSKTLIEAQEEIREMKRRFKIMNHQIEQLKEEITVKDHSLVKEHFHHHHVDKDKETLRNDFTKINKQIASADNIVANQRSEVHKLNQIIQEAEAERQRQVKELEAITGEKGILAGQLMQRNEELHRLYEKIKVQASSLQQGEVRFQSLSVDTRLLERDIGSMEAELIAAQGQLHDGGDLKGAALKLSKELMQEKARGKALSAELEKPINVHRWRALESSAPECFDMIKKIQSLQTRLISKTAMVTKKDLLIQEKERLYVELKNILGRQPGPEVAEQLLLYQDNLKEKVKQMAAMEEELDMYRQQVQLFKEDIDTCGRRVQGIKAEWLHKMWKTHFRPPEEGGGEGAGAGAGA